MSILTIIQLVVFLLYVGFIVKRYGILPSISDSWYVLPLRQQFLFTLFTWGIGIPMLLYGNVWFFLSGSGLSFVGVATQFKDKIGHTKEVHYIGALVGILGALIGIIVQYGNYVPLVWFIFLAISFQVSYMKNKIWWQEIVAVVLILWGLLVK